MSFRTVLAGLALIALIPFALAQERAAKPKATQPVQLEKAPATQPAELDKKPSRAGKQPYIERLQFTPDINQNMTIAELLEQIPKANVPEFTPPGEINVNEPYFMENMCAPASVTNHLLWLDRVYFKNISKEQHSIVAGVRLVNLLGRTEYMNTVRGGSGTSIKNLVRGTHRFLEKKGIDVKKVTVISKSVHADLADSYEVPKGRLKLENRMPKNRETKTALRKRAIVINLFGKYELKAETKANEAGKGQNRYLKRTGGHYFAPVGYGQWVEKVYDDNIIIYHNPADTPQNKQKQQYVKWVKESGNNAKLRMIKKNKPSDAFRACSFNKNWTCYGTLGGTYVRDKPLKDHDDDETVRILEALIVIEV